MGYLIDTNILSEVQKGERADPSVRAWYDRVEVRDLYLSVILPVSLAVAERWARNNVPDALPVIDGLLAATAQVHDRHAHRDPCRQSQAQGPVHPLPPA